jgi:hypothetical protein
MDKGDRPLKKNTKSPMKKEPKAKRAKAQRLVQRETKVCELQAVEDDCLTEGENK